MRFQLPTQLKTRSGDLDKDARVKNGYVEIKGEVGIVRKRPGSTDLGIVAAGTAQLLACFEDPLSIIDDSLSKIIFPFSVISIADLTPITPALSMTAQSTGSAQLTQQLLIKSREQAWIYTPE